MDTVAELEAVLLSLRGIWDEEAVDELDHALQAGYLAHADRADDELVLASVLHDIGHSPLLGAAPDHRHDAVARHWLTPRLGNRVGWLAGSHVAAKRYLALTDSTYAARLSPTSVASLAHQGGAGSDARWSEHPWWVDALRLRRFDDGAKAPGAMTLSIPHVLALARRVVARHDG
ncbi:HD family phosphohydrolase [Mycobacteroides saopaulense]|uniref:HD family phosphohydrolase n=1 Tax=Mycobacteroides saopaulense TaxID=1578165 RepID=A0A1S4VKB3_9MYCO|nr:HD family phosphohydrolase [Mycobacteroides saopaulense]ALR11202.1 HD family phosphohydrolase [Mycobacteroides saopaulense]ORB59638.1 HD family phosphohydrolase [Mycobacteroides saopaulense]